MAGEGERQLLKDHANLPKALAGLPVHGFRLDAMSTSYFLSRETLVPSDSAGMARWRQRLFAHMLRNASGLGADLKLPINSVVGLGSLVKF